MLTYVQRYPYYAGRWIYNGYAHAFAYLDQNVVFIDSLDEINTKEKYRLLCAEMMLNENTIDKMKNSYSTYLFVQPNEFPEPWGKHTAYLTSIPDHLIDKVNSLSNVFKWTFLSETKHHFKWSNTISLPLAFDNINYLVRTDDDYQYDICFVGHSVDNGLSEKVPIMNSVLGAFMESGLKCAFSVGQNISHELENEVIIKSKVSLNIHDAYQRVLGYDSNERTFKSLGINGLLVCDEVNQVKSLFPDIYLSNDPQKLIEKTKEYCSMNSQQLRSIKKANIDFVESNHTYIKRVEKLLNITK